MMDKIALFPGTFDPVTLGHVDIIRRALPLLDELYVGVGINAQKNTFFSDTERIQWLEEIYKDEAKVKVVSYEGLTVDFCQKIKAKFIVRGIRSVKDFEYEKGIADMNRKLNEEVETLFLFSSPEYGTLASTLVRDVIRNNGDISSFVPTVVVEDLNRNRYTKA